MLMLTALSDNIFLVGPLLIDDDPAFLRQVFHLQADSGTVVNPPAPDAFDPITQLTNFAIGVIIADALAPQHGRHRIDSPIVEQGKEFRRGQGPCR